MGGAAEPTERGRQEVKPQAAQDKPPAVPNQAVVTHANNVNQTRELCPLGSGEEMFIMFIVVTIVIFIIIRIIIYIVRHYSLNIASFFSYKDSKY